MAFTDGVKAMSLIGGFHVLVSRICELSQSVMPEVVELALLLLAGSALITSWSYLHVCGRYPSKYLI